MNNNRDCPHGRQIGKCADCDVERLEAENEALRVELGQALARAIERNNELEAELAEQARVNGMGSERELRLLALNAELVEALRDLEWAASGVEYMESEYANELSKARTALAKAGVSNG